MVQKVNRLFLPICLQGGKGSSTEFGWTLLSLALSCRLGLGVFLGLIDCLEPVLTVNDKSSFIKTFQASYAALLLTSYWPKSHNKVQNQGLEKYVPPVMRQVTQPSPALMGKVMYASQSYGVKGVNICRTVISCIISSKMEA